MATGKHVVCCLAQGAWVGNTCCLLENTGPPLGVTGGSLQWSSCPLWVLCWSIQLEKSPIRFSFGFWACRWWSSDTALCKPAGSVHILCHIRSLSCTFRFRLPWFGVEKEDSFVSTKIYVPYDRTIYAMAFHAYESACRDRFHGS